MPSRPLVWLTISFMLGISADHLFGESLPVPTYYFAFAALMLIAAMVISLWPRNRFANWSRLPSSVLRTFAIPALLFVIFGMWASKTATPQFPQALQPFLNGRPRLISPKSRPRRNIIRTELQSLCGSSGP